MEIQIFENPIHGNLEWYEMDGTIYLNLEQCARGLGFTKTETKDGKEYVSVRWARVEEYLSSFGFSTTSGRNETFIPENIFYRLAMKAKNEAAERFQAWIADEVLPSIRKTGKYAAPGVSGPTMQDKMIIVEGAARMLNMNDASKILMLERFCKQEGVPSGFLPSYEDNGGRQLIAATTLLKELGGNITIRQFNKVLMEQGFLEERERKGSKNTTKKFKALTEKGKKYGENLISPHNPREVQPLYYRDSFAELYEHIFRNTATSA